MLRTEGDGGRSERAQPQGGAPCVATEEGAHGGHNVSPPGRPTTVRGLALDAVG